VYYKGTASEWAEISVGSYNDSLTYATRYYYSDTEPTSEGNYWHYDSKSGMQIDLNNSTFDSLNFTIDSSGKISATDAELQGTITSASGNIGGFKINKNSLQSEDISNGIIISPKTGIKISGSNPSIQIGDSVLEADSNGSAVLRVNNEFWIRAANSTAIGLMGGYGTKESTFKLQLVHTQFHSANYSRSFTLKVVENPDEILYPITVDIEYEIYDQTFWGNVGDRKETGILSFYVDSNQLEHTLTTTGRTTWEYFRIKKLDGNWSDYYSVSNPDNGTVISEITETQEIRAQDIQIEGNLIPVYYPSHGDTTFTLGTNENKWNTVFAKTGAIQTSDENEKKNIQPLSEQYGQIFDALQPISFKFIENSSDRTHLGFGARAVKNAVEQTGLTTQDFAAYCEWQKKDGTIGCGLRYEEFISLCVDQIQKLKKRVDELEEQLNRTLIKEE
jgi:hypothetical protein